MKKEEGYVVWFEGIYKSISKNEYIKGYFAETQPYYELDWIFTEDINKAKIYKTLKNAEEREYKARNILECKIFKIEVERKVNILSEHELSWKKFAREKM